MIGGCCCRANAAVVGLGIHDDLRVVAVTHRRPGPLMRPFDQQEMTAMAQSESATKEQCRAAQEEAGRHLAALEQQDGVFRAEIERLSAELRGAESERLSAGQQRAEIEALQAQLREAGVRVQRGTVILWGVLGGLSGDVGGSLGYLMRDLAKPPIRGHADPDSPSSPPNRRSCGAARVVAHTAGPERNITARGVRWGLR